MLNIQYDIERRKLLKDILLRLRHGEVEQSVKAEVKRYIEDVGIIGVLLIKQALINNDEGITIEDAKRLSVLYPELTEIATSDSMHPVNVFKRENRAFQSAVDEITHLLKLLADEPEKEAAAHFIEEVQGLISSLGSFHQHYHRKEKLLFPIMERYGHYRPTRMMWEEDDRIRALYQGIKRRVEQLPNGEVVQVQKRFDVFKKEFESMIYQEEAILFPILFNLFNEENWAAVAKESEAFGYALIDVEEVWMSATDHSEERVEEKKTQEHFRFGGGYLTTEEANLILNHLPLEITFVDKNSIFKYFNEMTEASEMMLVRTPISIGRNVANCHPPKSLRKVMTLIRDLIAKKRTSESMWFKKNGQYIHLTYKALFDDEGEYLGILEYVQDIQPFFELPEEVKMGLSPID